MEKESKLSPYEECCYRSVFSDKCRRIGRCSYICDYCGKDVSMLWAFYNLSKSENIPPPLSFNS